ncbi:MAG: hypothetical protein SGI99_10765 [Pseudomonadota bacterium]|nr:hypothetical protein [Pseudomonadota bacterium]
MSMPEWLKRDAGQLVSGLVQTLVFVALGTWYVGGRLAAIDTRALVQAEKLERMQERMDQVESNASLYRSEVLAEVRGARLDLRSDLQRLEDKIDERLNGRHPP